MAVVMGIAMTSTRAASRPSTRPSPSARRGSPPNRSSRGRKRPWWSVRGRGNPHGQVRAHRRAVPLGPLRQGGRKLVLLGAGQPSSLGGQKVRGDVHPARRPRGHRGVSGRRPGSAHRHGPRVQRRRHPALRSARQQDQDDAQVGVEQGCHRVQRAALRRQNGFGAGVRPRGKGHGHPRQERPQGNGPQRPAPARHQQQVRESSTPTGTRKSACRTSRRSPPITT